MSLKNKIRVTLQKNKLFNKVYDVYHEQAKYIYNRNNPKLILHSDVSINLYDDYEQTFFGYYDKSPVRNGKVAYHGVSASLNLKQEIDIVVDGFKVSSTNTWNWQQGSMLTWLNDDSIVHNFFDGKFKAKIIDIKSKDERVIDYPIYSVSPCSKYSATVNFSRLAKLRPDYGYFNLDYKNVVKNSSDDGLFLIDIEKNRSKLLISLEALSKYEERESMKDAYHKVNHPMYSPDGNSIIFLHRWYDLNDKKYSRLMRINVDGSDLKLLSDYDMVSHCNYYNENVILGYLRGPERKDAYYLIEDNKFEKILEGVLEEDGHPSYSKDKRYILTDTYPNHTCRSKVLLYDTKTNKLHVLGEFFSPKKYKGVNRCDHHPRFDGDHHITFDTVHTGKRLMCRMDVSKIINGGD